MGADESPKLVIFNFFFVLKKEAASIGDNIETMKRNYEGFCKNRWRDAGDLEQMNQINKQRTKHRLKVVE